MPVQLEQQAHAYRQRGQFQSSPPTKVFQPIRPSEETVRVTVWTAPPGQPRQQLGDQWFPPEAQQQVILGGRFASARANQARNARDYLGTAYVSEAGQVQVLLCSSDRPLRPEALQLELEGQEARCPPGSGAIALE